jgi:8-oxo-dGTP pyrophosphatase MutT (NUDIX family)
MLRFQIENQDLCQEFDKIEYEKKFHELQTKEEIEYLWSSWSGVVILVVVEDSLVLVKRSAMVPSYRGQVAYIGGKKEHDETHPLQVARREFEEETHLAASSLEFLGMLPFVRTSSSQTVIPYVAFCHLSKENFLKEIKTNGEWEEVFLVDFKILCDSSRWTSALYETDGRMKRSLYFFSFLSSEIQRRNVHTLLDVSYHHPFVLWGASAKMTLYLLTIYLQEKN